MVESSVVIYYTPTERGGLPYDIVDVQRGHPGQVTFDFFHVWEYKKRTKNFQLRNLVFYHVHPASIGVAMSSMDDNCLRGYDVAFKGMPKFNIVCFTNPDDIFDLEHSIGRYGRGVAHVPPLKVLQLLKLLSLSGAQGDNPG